jgi:hypothetical protein
MDLVPTYCILPRSFVSFSMPKRKGGETTPVDDSRLTNLENLGSTERQRRLRRGVFRTLNIMHDDEQTTSTAAA